MTVAQLAEERRDRRRVLWLLVALAVVAVVAIIWGIPHIESSRTAAAEQELATAGWDGIDVEFSGRDATLTGTVPVGVEVDDVVQRVDDIWGVRVVTARLEQPVPDETTQQTTATVVTPDPEPELMIAVSGGRVSLQGLVPSQSAVDTAVNAATIEFGEAGVVNELEIAEVASPGWLNALWAGFGDFATFGDFELRVAGGRATLGGEVDSDEVRAAIVTGLQAAVSPPLEVVDTMTLAALPDPTITVTKAAEGVAVDGTLPDQASITAAGAALGDRFGPDAVDNRLLVGRVGAPGWLGGLWDAFGSLPRNGEYVVTVGEGAVVLAGDVASEAARDAAGAALEAALGPDYTLDNQMLVSDEVAAAACPVADLNDVLDVGVLFALDSAVLQEEALADLDPIVEVLIACEGVPVEVGGHTDSSGPDDYNLELSQARADAVADYLVEQGVPDGQLTAVGYGETEPAASNNSAAGRAENRRIEFTLEGT